MKMVSVMSGLLFRSLLCLFVTLFSFSGAWAQRGGVLLSQIADGEQTNAIEQLIEQSREEGAQIIIIGPPEMMQKEPLDPMHSMSAGEKLLQARWRLKEIVERAVLFFGDSLEALRNASMDGTLFWLFRAISIAVAGLLAGFLFYKLIDRWMRQQFRYLYDPKEPARRAKLGYLLTRIFAMAFSVAIMFGTALLVAIVFDNSHEPSRATIFSIVASYSIYRFVTQVILLNIFVPDSGACRLINLSDERAKKVYLDWKIVLAPIAALLCLGDWITRLRLGEDLSTMVFIGASGIAAFMLILLTIHHRKDIIGIVRGHHSKESLSRWHKYLCKFTVPAIVSYLVVAWLAATYQLVLGLGNGVILVGAPLIVCVGAMFAYAIAIYLLDVFYDWREKHYIARKTAKAKLAEVQAEHQPIPAAALYDDDDGRDEHEEMIVHKAERQEPEVITYTPMFKNFFETAIMTLLIIVAIGELGRLWGLDLGREGGHPFAQFLDNILIVIYAWLAYRAVNNYIDAKIIEEGGTLGTDTPAPGETDMEGGVGQSRLATLLPIFRNVLIAMVVSVSVAMFLSNLGVDIAPLIAGAGVIGIAIGFGAQTLIRDIFSGVFFLVDDAFRKGEYIEVGSVKGVIEKISVRSFQLRHHLGAVHTVPFGEIQQLTNFSRDWVMMKLPLRLTYDTDVEKVRKLIKKLGIALLDHPDVGHLFLQPVKSQGVYAMEDSAMIIRIKFMTRPGDQFVTRKVVYAKIRELFAREDISFAHREVTVRLADDVDAKNLTDQEKDAIAGSVRAAIDEEPAKKSPGNDR